MNGRVLEWIAANWLTVALFIASVPVAWFSSYYFWRRQKYVLSYTCTNLFTAIGFAVDLIPNLSVRYKGYGGDIGSFTISTFTIWNSGTEPITKSHLVQASPLALQADSGVVILDAKLVRASSESTCFEVTRSKDRNRALVAFKYLNPHDGAVLVVLHTGSESGHLRLEGRLVGAGEPVPVEVANLKTIVTKENIEANVKRSVAAGIFMIGLTAIGSIP